MISTAVALALLTTAAQRAEEPTVFALDVEFVVEHEVPVAGLVPTFVRATSVVQLLPDGSARNEICDISLQGDSALTRLDAPADLASVVETTRGAWRVDERGRVHVDLGEQSLQLRGERRALRLRVGGIGLFAIDVQQRLRFEIVDPTARSRAGPLVIRSFEQHVSSSGPVPLDLAGRLASGEDRHRFRARPVAASTRCETLGPAAASDQRVAREPRPAPRKRTAHR
jgi:hypothetical protein